MSSPADPELEPIAHRPYEDVLALLTGTLFVALGVTLFGHTGLITGGTAGVAFLIHYATGWNFGAVFFAINLPFYKLAWQRMGRVFALKTLASVSLLAVWTQLLAQNLRFALLHPLLSATLGGALMGCGMLILFRHRASLGGFNVLVLYLQERLGWRAGWLQMGLDCSIVVVSFALRAPALIALSVLGAVVVNQTLATNHRAGRYMGM